MFAFNYNVQPLNFALEFDIYAAEIFANHKF